MDPLLTHLQPFFQQPFFQWLLAASWQAGVLVCLILLVQKALGRWIGVRGRYWLWLVLLIRMVMFSAPPSAVSVYNLLPPPRLAGGGSAATPQSGNVGSALAATEGPSIMMRGRAGAGPAADNVPETGVTTNLGSWARHWAQEWGAVLFLLWLAGACTLTGYIIAGHVHLRRIVRSEPPVINRWIHRLLRDCQRDMGMKRAVEVIATDRVDSPALLGCLRPRLLLPRQTMAELGPRELRHIFLHELAHLRRDDIVVGYLATLLQVLHWFNPLIALAFKRMRADREMVCDALAMSALPAEETDAYGHTVIHQIEQSLASRPRWMLAALSGDRARIKQRIAAVSQFRKETFRCSPLAFVLIGLLACTGLTNALPVVTLPVYGPAKDVPTTHQDKHANIERIVLRHKNTAKYLVVHGETVTCDVSTPGDEGLWEARFDEDFGMRDQIVYFYSVAACKYLTSDQEGNIAVNGAEPNEAARCSVWNAGDGRCWIMPRQCKGSYLCVMGQGQVKAVYNKTAPSYWEIDQLWRVKTSDYPEGVAKWHREQVPGPDWGPPWSTQRRNK